MRSAIVLVAAAAALSALSTTDARAQGWCSYATHPKSLIQCGYTSNTDCQNAVGKDGTCFLDPEFALNTRRIPLPRAHPVSAET
jgi:hypothetical protein